MSWAKEDQVYCLRKDSIFRANPVVLAVENYFYKIDLIDTQEYKLVKALGVPEQQLPFLKEINNGWLEFFDSVFLLLKSAKSANDLVTEKSVSLQAMEDFHCQIEGRGIYLSDLLDQNLDFWKDENKRIDFLFYLSFQYLRTKRMRNACLNVWDDVVKKSCNNNLPTLSSTGYTILSVLFSSNMAYAFSKESASIKLIKNNSGSNFITGDQPVVNVIRDKNEGELYHKDAELYYPISPKLGVFISHSEKFSLGYGDEVNVGGVSYLNSLIVDNYEEQLFGNRKEDLTPFCK